MFFGKVVSEKAPYRFSASEGNQEHEVLSLTNLTLAPSSKDSTSIYIKRDTE